MKAEYRGKWNVKGKKSGKKKRIKDPE